VELYVVNAGVWEDYAGWGRIWLVGVYSTPAAAEEAVKLTESTIEGAEAWVEDECELDVTIPDGENK
jgi:hypothetical protein